MDSNKKELTKILTQINKGAKEFRDESVKPHLEILADYASKCKVVTELGIRTGCSTIKFLFSGCKKVYSYNINVSPNARKIKQAAEKDGVYFRLITKENLNTKIKKTDMLFIDTDHWYGQIKAELNHHHKQVNKWIIMNNTETFGMVNPFDGRPGMKAAIFEFLEANPEWQFSVHIESGHGLTVLEKEQTVKNKLFGFLKL